MSITNYDEIVLNLLQNDDLEALKDLFNEETVQIKKPNLILQFATLISDFSILQYLVEEQNIKPEKTFENWLNSLKENVSQEKIQYSDEDTKNNQIKNIQFIEQYI